MPWDNSPAARRASDATYGSSEYRTQRAIARQRARGRCECQGCTRHTGPCGTRGRLECDHITPRSKGGTHHHTNLRMLCTSCHGVKTATEGGGGRSPTDPHPTPRTKWYE